MFVVPAPRTIVRLDVGTLLYPWVGCALYTCHVLREGRLKNKGGVSVEDERRELGERPSCGR